MPLSPKKLKDFEAMVNAKVWKDPKFRKKLLEDPKGALKEMGVDIPKNINVRIVEDDKTTVTLVILPSPEHATEMDERELRKVAGGEGCYRTCDKSAKGYT
jgi:hypothetical protein